MTTANIISQVEDYDHWRSVYDAQAERAADAGRKSENVYRNADDPNDIVLVGTWESAERFQALMESPELRAAFVEAGVQGAPVIHVID